ncbi:MAG: S8 family serine peptidase, partial [Acidobacteriota bacterium]|nr:S8 family serine peptidase [Acidobacteriota bacterium]
RHASTAARARPRRRLEPRALHVGKVPIVLAATALAAVALAPAASPAPRPLPPGAPGPPRRLCGLNQTIDTLLGCRSAQSAAATTATEPAASPTPAASPSAPAASATLAAAPPLLRSSTRPTYLPGTLLVRFRTDVARARIAGLLRRLGARTDERIPRLGIRVVLVRPSRRAAVLAALRRSRLVASATRDELLHTAGVTTNDVFFDQQWGLQLAGFPTAWERTQGASSVTVAVVDTGVDAGQPDLAGAVLPGVDLVNGTTDATDDNGHGTAVAGVIAARADNNLGGAGACWHCTILPIKVLGANGTGDTATVAEGIVRAADLGARVINLSLGGPQSLPALQQAIAYASGKGAIIVAAAGNSGLATPFYPAGYGNVISVAGTDQNDQLYPWSDYGPWVAVSAPGCNIAPLLGGGYGDFCGTSSATPLVSGLAALALAASPQATPAQITSAIEQDAHRLAFPVAYGRIDAASTLTTFGTAPATQTTLTLHGILQGSTRNHAYHGTTGAGPVVATLHTPQAKLLQLTLLDATGHIAATRRARGPLTITATLASGPYRIAVRDFTRTPLRYTLTLAYPAT